MDSQQLTEAPAIAAPKTGLNFFRFDPFPASGSYVLTLVASEFTKDHETEYQGEKKVFDAIEFFFGAIVDGKPYFIGTGKKGYTLGEKALFPKWVKALGGQPPVPGKTRPSDYYGLHFLANLENENKVSRKGTPYTITKIESFTKTPAAMAAQATPREQLLEAFQEAIKPKDRGEGQAAQATSDNSSADAQPF